MGKKINNYIGIPYKWGGCSKQGLDCWGLVRLVSKNEYNIKLPKYIFEFTDKKNRNELNDFFIDKKNTDFTEIKKPMIGSIVLLKMGLRILHCGIMVSKNGFLHCLESEGVVFSRINDPIYKQKVIAFYVLKR